MYEFEKDLAENRLSIDVINARRYAASIRKAMEVLQAEAAVYHLTQQPYHLDTQAFLEQMAARFEAVPQGEKGEKDA